MAIGFPYGIFGSVGSQRFEPIHKRGSGNRPPGVNDDETLGFDSWSYWVDTSGTNPEIYRCLDATSGAAKWLHTSLDLEDLGTAAIKDVPMWGDAGVGQVVLGSDTRLTDFRYPIGGMVSDHVITYNHDDIHEPTSVSGDGITISGQEISLSIGTSASNVAAGDHDHTKTINVIDTEFTVWEIKDINNVVVSKCTVECSNIDNGSQESVIHFYRMVSGTLTKSHTIS